jgi:hypothetical protein
MGVEKVKGVLIVHTELLTKITRKLVLLQGPPSISPQSSEFLWNSSVEKHGGMKDLLFSFLLLGIRKHSSFFPYWSLALLYLSQFLALR